MQIIVLPSRLMGGAISQVYISRVPQALKDGNLKDFTRSIILRMAKLGVAPFLLIGVISPILVPHIFGGNWGRSGEIISWLIPWVVMQFIVSPVSMVLHVVGKQNEAMFIQAFGMILRIGTVILAIHFFPENIVEIFAISGAIFYILYFFLINKVVGQAGGMK
jgi:O-antigen/teichoic acid export membrane protein